MDCHADFRMANDEDTPADTLALLALSTDELVRGAVALNANTPSSILNKLREDASDHVQACLLLRKG